ncbi:hypothetical protein ACFL13_02435 [Patescibacteria group bacterium]
MSSNFFKFKGTPLNLLEKTPKIETLIMEKEKISSLFDTSIVKLNPVKELLSNKSLLTNFALGVVSLFIVFSVFIFQIPISKASTKVVDKYSIFSLKPLTLDRVDYNVGLIDSKAKRIDSVFAFYRCPLEGYGQVFVEEAEVNEIPYWLLAALSFQESGCGKNTPSIEENGPETYNLFGWGVWGNQVFEFDSYEHAISTVSKYMGKKFYSQGITNLCEIMRTYTPPSDGSWCGGVEYFGEMIQNYKSPKL